MKETMFPLATYHFEYMHKVKLKFNKKREVVPAI